MAVVMSPLHTLAYVYFGEDSHLFGPDPDSIIRFSIGGQPTELIDEIQAALAHNPSEDELRRLWYDTYNSGFEPGSIGLTYRAWFQHMLEVLRAE